MSPAGETRRIAVSGRKLHVRLAGSGPAMLLLHGIPTNGSLWREVVPRLAPRARLVVPDLLGYGESDRPDGRPVDLLAQAGYLLELLDALEIERITVVGHDIGGGIAQILAVRHPERVERLGLLNAVCYDSWPIPGMYAIQMTAPLVERLPAGLTLEGIRLGLRRGFLHQERAEEYLERFLAPFSTAEGMDTFVQLARALDNRSTREIAPSLPDLRLPCAVVWGRHDPFQEAHWAERLASDIPTAELTWVEASHFSPVDAPAPVARALERLMQR